MANTQAFQGPLNYLDQSGGVMSAISDDLMPDSACRLSVNFRYRPKRGAASKRQGYKKTLHSGTYSMAGNAAMANKPCMGMGSFRDWAGAIACVFGAWDGKTFMNSGPYGFLDTVIGTHADKTAKVRYVQFLNKVFRVGGGDDTRSWDGKATGTFGATLCAMAPRAELAARFKSRLILGRLTGHPAVADRIDEVPDATVSAVLSTPAYPGNTELHLDTMPFPGVAVSGQVWLGDEQVTYSPTAHPTMGGPGVIYTDVNGGSDHILIHDGTFADVLPGARIVGSNPGNPSDPIDVNVVSIVGPGEIVVSSSIDLPYGIYGWTYKNTGNNDGREGNDLMGVAGVTQFWPAGTAVKTYQDTILLEDSSDFADSGSFHIGSEVVTYTGNNRGANTLTGCSGFAVAYPLHTAVTQDAIAASLSSIYRSSVPDTDGTISWDPVATDAGEIIINPDDGDDLRAVVMVGGYLQLMKSRATYRWNGTSTDPEPLIDVGAVSQEAVVTVKEKAYWFGSGAFFEGTGQTPTEISKYIKDWAHAITPDKHAGIVAYTDGDTAWWFLGDIVKDGRTFRNCCLEYDPDTASWAVHELHDPVTAATRAALLPTAFLTAGDEMAVIEGTKGQGWFMFSGYADDDDKDIGFERQSRGMWFDSPATTKRVEEVAWFIEGCSRAKLSVRDAGKKNGTDIRRREANKDVGMQSPAEGRVLTFALEGASKTPVEWRGFSISKIKSLGIT